MGWQKLNLARKDGRPEPGQLCVISRVWKGFGEDSKPEYLVGTFVTDPRDPESRKLWWRGGDSHVLQNPAYWTPRYRDLKWVAVEAPAEGR